jgi:8-oxo-dGTP pyrophosphatase MutT (NUDIX family)
MEDQKRIKVKSLAWLENEGMLFVVKIFDTFKNEDFYRPIGGTVEFGESALQALQREVAEEMNTRVSVIAAPLILENLFVCDGNPGHEIVYLYPCRFCEANFYERKTYRRLEANGRIMDALWVSIAEFLSGKYRLVPEAFMDLIKEKD